VTGLLWLVQGFHELSTCRALGFGAVGPIPLTAMWQYVDRHGLPDWTVDVWLEADGEYLRSISDDKVKRNGKH
jgi:hypothetical protein